MLALNKLGRFKEALDISIRLYMYTLVEADQNKIDLIRNTLKTNLNINIDDYIIIKKEV